MYVLLGRIDFFESMEHYQSAHSTSEQGVEVAWVMLGTLTPAIIESTKEHRSLVSPIGLHVSAPTILITIESRSEGPLLD